MKTYLPLINHGLRGLEYVFNGLLNGYYVVGSALTYHIDERRHSGGLPVARWSGNQDYPLVILAYSAQ